MKTVKIKTRPTIYLSDIHGDIDSLDLLDTFIKDYPADKYNLVFGGDYIDGDPGGFKCLYFVKNMQDTRDNTYVLKGNHEQMLINYLQMPDEFNKRQYYMNGGKHTLRAALGTGASAEVMASAIRGTFPELVKWVYKLPTAVYDDHKLCVHAGIDWGAEPWFNTDDTQAIWTRDAYIYD